MEENRYQNQEHPQCSNEREDIAPPWILSSRIEGEGEAKPIPEQEVSCSSSLGKRRWGRGIKRRYGVGDESQPGLVGIPSGQPATFLPRNKRDGEYVMGYEGVGVDGKSSIGMAVKKGE
nr:uncharacterized protein LOC102631485 [Ipomoea batatas]